MMKKHKILISLNGMELGGVERSLICLLDSFDYNNVHVDLCVHNQSGPLMEFVPKEVNVLPEVPVYKNLFSSLKTLFNNKQYKLILLRVLAKLHTKFFKRFLSSGLDNYSGVHYISKYSECILPKINDVKYDLALSFVIPHNIVLFKVKSSKKIAWIHTDYSTVDIDVQSELPIWRGYDYIVSISDSVTEAFVKIFPSLSDKVIKIENVLSKRLVLQQSDIKSSDFEIDAGSDYVKFCSVGRFCHQKAFDNAIEICNSLLIKGVMLKWYLIGFGPDEELLKSKIKEYNLHDYFIILGKKTNPFPYINACDFYVQPSRYEGKSVAVREAQMLSKPVIITNYPTAKSQINDKKDGFIVPMEISDAAEAIYSILNDTESVSKVTSYLPRLDFSNSGEVSKILELV